LDYDEEWEILRENRDDEILEGWIFICKGKDK
jgi:hypothetical protein